MFSTGGEIHVITGPMKSRKTLDLIMRGHDSIIAGLKVLAISPAMSERWKRSTITSRVGSVQQDEMSSEYSFSTTRVEFPAISVARDLNDFTLPDDIEVLLIDEAQFFESRLISLVSTWRDQGVTIYVSGLDMDCFRQPYGPIPYLMAIADTVSKKHAVCEMCGTDAIFTFRENFLAKDRDMPGDSEYKAVCSYCYNKLKAEALAKLYDSDSGDLLG